MSSRSEVGSSRGYQEKVERAGIYGRGSLRQDFEKIVDAGKMAPPGHNTQPWDFIVVTQKGKSNKESLKKSAC